jgi:hypothetical protein
MNDAAIVDPAMNEDEATTIAVGATTVAETTEVADTTEVTDNIEVADNIEDGDATQDETVNSGIREEETTYMDDIMEEADAAPVAAGSEIRKENAEESTVVVPAPTSEENKDAPTADVKEEISQEQAGEFIETMADAKVEISDEQQANESIGAMADAKMEPSIETESPAKETKKRVRRVGRTPTRKIAKLEEKIIPSMDVDVGDNNNSHVTAAVDAATAAIGAVPEAVGDVAMGSLSTIDVAPPPVNQGVLSKHDEKWHGMFQKLSEFKERNKHTLVPQCYSEDPR